MRIMLDTNVLISMVFFPGNRFRQILETITTKHTLVLSSFVIEELISVAERKFPRKKEEIDNSSSFVFTMDFICSILRSISLHDNSNRFWISLSEQHSDKKAIDAFRS